MRKIQDDEADHVESPEIDIEDNPEKDQNTPPEQAEEEDLDFLSAFVDSLGSDIMESDL